MSDNYMTLVEFFDSYSKLGEGEVILDVRRPEEFQEARIAKALNIPVDEVANHAEELKKYKKIYIHCKRGGRAKTAFEALKNQGLNNLVCVHDAGMDLWIEKGYPVERG